VAPTVKMLLEGGHCLDRDWNPICTSHGAALDSRVGTAGSKMNGFLIHSLWANGFLCQAVLVKTKTKCLALR